jgi:hydroxyacylglutathione hydrolase
MMKNLNKVDRPLLTEVPKLKKLDYKELSSSALAKKSS